MAEAWTRVEAGEYRHADGSTATYEGRAGGSRRRFAFRHWVLRATKPLPVAADGIVHCLSLRDCKEEHARA